MNNVKQREPGISGIPGGCHYWGVAAPCAGPSTLTQVRFSGPQAGLRLCILMWPSWAAGLSCLRFTCPASPPPKSDLDVVVSFPERLSSFPKSACLCCEFNIHNWPLFCSEPHPALRPLSALPRQDRTVLALHLLYMPVYPTRCFVCKTDQVPLHSLFVSSRSLSHLPTIYSSPLLCA